MKQKLLMMLAALMLMGTSAMAQSETLKGDVNGDGVVDVADIAAVIKVMNEQSKDGVKYYWYAGQEKPTSMDSEPTASEKYTCNNWFYLGTISPNSIIQQITEGVRGSTWYAVVPADAGLVPGSQGIIDTSIGKIGTITVCGLEYDIWEASGVTATRFNVKFFRK
jgi:hypothetical protein